jgi:hypothetical protein
MRLTIRTLYIALLAMLAWACTPDRFTVEGEITGADRVNLRAIYHADGATRAIPVTADGGKFILEARAEEPAVLELFATDGTVVGRMVVANGMKLRCRFNLADPYDAEITGDDLSQRWALFLSDNAATLRSAGPAAVNSLVARYAESHKDDALSTLLIVTLYDAGLDPTGAAKLFGEVDTSGVPQAFIEDYSCLIETAAASRAARRLPAVAYITRDDTLVTLNPRRWTATLISLSAADTGRRDSLVAALRAAERSTRSRRVMIADLSADGDTIAWRRSVAADSASWLQGYVPGGLGSTLAVDLGVTTLPYFAVADSSGRLLYAGPSMSKAIAKLK